MKNLFFVCFLFLFLSKISLAQEKQIKGYVVDSSSGKFLINASVVLLTKKDSFIIADTRSDSSGLFKFEHIPDTMQYFLFISYPKFVSHSMDIDLSKASNSFLDLKAINMLSQGRLLQEVVVKARFNSIRIRGDTVNYATDKIVLPPNATVEDLLRVLPGLQVDQKGQITAQGKRIKQIFVDGEEFFSDDPTLVTKNLRSDMIANVQVYDQKSESAKFTGIEDGIKDRVINLKLKEDKTKGLFGKAEAGAGTGAETNTYYLTQAMLNWFRKKNKISAYFSSNNIGQWGLRSSDKNKLGFEDASDNYDIKGLPTATFGGFHYDNKWNNDRSSLNGDHHYSLIDILRFDSTFSQNKLPNGIINRYSSSQGNTEDQAHKANLTYKHKLDSTSSITLYTAGAAGKSNKLNFYSSSDRDGAQNLLNQNSIQTDEQTKFRNYALNILWQKKLKRTGRTLSVTGNTLVRNEEEIQDYLSTTIYYNGKPVADSINPLNFLRESDVFTRKLTASIKYTERLTKNKSVMFSYNAAQDYSDDNKLSFASNVLPNGQFDSSFSTDRINNKWSHTTNINWNLTFDKTRIIAGTEAGIALIKMDEKINTARFNRVLAVWKPMVSFQHDIRENTKFSISYKGVTLNPDFKQILPYNFENTQLITYLANYELNNSFSNTFLSSYESFKNFTSAFTAITSSYSIVSNPLTLGINIDESGAYTLRYINLAGYSNSMLDVSGFYSRPIKNPKFQLTIDMNIKSGRTFNYVNDFVNKLNYGMYSVGFFGAKNKSNKYDLNLGTSVSYNANLVTGNEETVHNNFFSYSIKPSAKFYLFKKLEIFSDAEYLWQEKTSVFPNNFDRLIWNAKISGNLLRNSQLTFSLACNDLLNSNTGFSRNASNSFFIENRYLTIRRYIMLSASWNFTKFKKVKTQ